jgi:glucose dehydrogenase
MSGTTAAVCYLVITLVFVVSAVTFLTAQADPSSLYTSITITLFGVPAFFLGLILFTMLDWGLKTLWKKHSRFGIIPITIALSIPFIWEYFQAPESNDILISSISAIVLLACSVYLVRLQIGSGSQVEKTKHGE